MIQSMNPAINPGRWQRRLRYRAAALRAGQAIKYADGLATALYAVPDHPAISVAPLAPFEGKVWMRTPAWLWAVSGSSQRAAGFDFQIRDGGTQQELFSRRLYYSLVTGQGQTAEGAQSIQAVLPKPLLILQPGLVIVQLFNLSDQANEIQLVLWCVIPEVKP
jgi:hypothetical protein